MAILKPYDSVLPTGYEQKSKEYKFIKLKEDSTSLTTDGFKVFQDELNLDRDTNSIYKIIDKFQNTNALMSKIEESIEFMKKIGKDPSNAFNGEVVDLTIAPKSLQEAAAMGARAKEVLNAYIHSQNTKSNTNNSAETTTKSVGQTNQEATTNQNQNQEVGDK